MHVMLILIRRHMMLFFKDKTAVFFAFMAVFVVLFLYIAFLGNVMITPLKALFPQTAREISDTWIMAGTMGLVSLTSSLSVCGILIEDRQNQILQDFYTAPISRMHIACSYMLSTIVITLIISLITFLVAQCYIVAYGGQWLSFMSCIKVIGCMLLSISACTSMLYFIMSFFKSATAFSNVTTIIGTLSGFLMGIYVPIASLPMFLQNLIRYFPPSHGAVLFRKAMMEDVLLRSNIPLEMESQFREQFGLTFQYGNITFTTAMHIALLIMFGIVFLWCTWKKRK